MFKRPAFTAVPREVTVDVSQNLHEVRLHRSERNGGGFPHMNGALLCQVHVVKVDELKLGLFLWSEWTHIHQEEQITQKTAIKNTIVVTHGFSALKSISIDWLISALIKKKIFLNQRCV